MTKPFGTAAPITRRPGPAITVAVSATIANCGVIDMAAFSGATVLLLTGSATAGTIYGADTLTGSFNPVCDSDGVALTVALDNAKRCQLPTASWSEEFIKIVTDETGTVSIKPKS